MVLPDRDSSPVELLVLRKEMFVSLHLRMAFHMSGIPHVYRATEPDRPSLQDVCTLIRAGTPSPDMILIESDRHELTTVEVVDLVRTFPELSGVPFVVLGRSDDLRARTQAAELGAYAFLAAPRRTGELPQAAADIALLFRQFRARAG